MCPTPLFTIFTALHYLQHISHRLLIKCLLSSCLQQIFQTLSENWKFTPETDLSPGVSDPRPAASRPLQWPRLGKLPESRCWWEASHFHQQCWFPALHMGLHGGPLWQLSLLQEGRGASHSLEETPVTLSKKASLKKVISTSFQPLAQSWLDVIIHFLYKTTARKEIRYFIIQGPFEKILSERNRWCHTLLSRQRRGFRAVPARGGGANGAQEMDTGITEGPLHPGNHTLQPYYTYRQKDTKRWMTAILLTLLTIQGR